MPSIVGAAVSRMIDIEVVALRHAQPGPDVMFDRSQGYAVSIEPGITGLALLVLHQATQLEKKRAPRLAQRCQGRWLARLGPCQRFVEPRAYRSQRRFGSPAHRLVLTRTEPGSCVKAQIGGATCRWGRGRSPVGYPVTADELGALAGIFEELDLHVVRIADPCLIGVVAGIFLLGDFYALRPYVLDRRVEALDL